MLTSFDPQNVRSLVNGEALTSGSTQPILSPHDSAEVGRLHLADASTASAAVSAAREAQASWAAVPAVQRGAILHKACNLIEARAEELSRIVACEAGKSLKDARGETAGAILCGRFFAGEGQRMFGRTMPSGTPEKSAMTVRQPCGVAALITAANTPAPNFAWKVFPALVCGNSVVLKPAEETPVSADWMARILIGAGIPPGVLNVVHGLGSEVGPVLASHPGVDVISFTGSTRVGRLIAEQAGRELKKVSLELGGKNAFIVCDDADIDKAVHWASLSAFSNAGQRCASGSRFIVMDNVYDDFVNRFVAKAKSLRLGVEDDCDLGPVINLRQLSAMLAALERAKAEGAEVLCGGQRAETAGLGNGFYLNPTLVTNLPPHSHMAQTELFGPIGIIFRVGSFEEAINLANNSPYGLTGAIHTRSWDRAWTFTQRLSAGIAVVNAGTFGSEPHMPFGGLRNSGNGTREPGTEALDIYTELKDIYLITEPERL
ncbi:aldehyde dehydrogenase family protein [Hyphomonas sp.]|uniref:aldehyde dehydrogenase family protein n=1 Tax=Hyphomonas sp. TaxID=87 RepID=UPI001BCEA07F|nr:aldehyde dehydrogenase family protein [Hyphomonas sp.]